MLTMNAWEQHPDTELAVQDSKHCNASTHSLYAPEAFHLRQTLDCSCMFRKRRTNQLRTRDGGSVMTIRNFGAARSIRCG